MNYYNSFINTVQKLPFGTVFEITTDWLNANGISGATPSDAIAIGKKFSKEYLSFGCKSNGTGSDNHHSYTKI